MATLEFDSVRAEATRIRDYYDLVLGVSGTLRLCQDGQELGVADETPLVELRILARRWLEAPTEGGFEFETLETDDFSLLRAQPAEGRLELGLTADPNGKSVLLSRGEVERCLRAYCAAVDEWVLANLSIDVEAFLRRHSP